MEAQKGIEAVEKRQRERTSLHQVTLVILVVQATQDTLITLVILGN